LIASALRFFIENLGKKIKMITKTESNSALFLLESGELYAVGSKSNGTTGISGTTGTFTIPTKLSLINVKKIASTLSAVYALTDNGQLYQWGKNSYGYLLTNTGVSNTVYDTPRLTTFTFPSAIKDIISCRERFFVLCEDGTVYGWGFNNYYQLGNGTNTSSRTPSVVLNVGINVKKIVSTYYNTIFLKGDGIVYGCGFNNDSSLGMGHANAVTSPTQNPFINEVTDVFHCANFGFIYLKNKSIYYSGIKTGIGGDGVYSTPSNIYTSTSEIKFSEDGDRTGSTEGAMFRDGVDLYIIGNTRYKNYPQYTGASSNEIQLGLPLKINTPPVEKFFSDAYGNTIMITSGETFLVGDNASYQLGLGHNVTQYIYSKIEIN
jgi:hypothetical protein